jgi:hypothetical protein
MKKFICLGILVLMTVVCVVPACATDGTTNVGTQGVVAPQWTYISLLSPGLSINSTGKSTCMGLASAYDSSHTTILTVELQKSAGSSWNTIKTWSASSTGVSIATVEESYYVINGTYRVCATAKVYNASGNLLESKSIYSSTVIY